MMYHNDGSYILNGVRVDRITEGKAHKKHRYVDEYTFIKATLKVYDFALKLLIGAVIFIPILRMMLLIFDNL